jgi:hypothetical protein
MKIKINGKEIKGNIKAILSGNVEMLKILVLK